MLTSEKITLTGFSVGGDGSSMWDKNNLMAVAVSNLRMIPEYVQSSATRRGTCDS